MAVWLRVMNWPLRAKMAVLLVVASLVPLGIATWISVGNARADRYQSAEQLLTVQTKMIARQIDAFNNSYSRVANLLALASPQALTLAQGKAANTASVRQTIHGQLRFWTSTDPVIRGISLIDVSGRVVIGTEPALEGSSLPRDGFLNTAMAGMPVVSDIFLSPPEVGAVPTIAYLAPIRAADGKVQGVAAVWVNASIFAKLLREENDTAGPGSFAVLVDSLGIRIAHPNKPDAVFHPVEALPPATIDALVAERRFGARTRELVSDVLGVSWEPPVAREKLPDIGMFRAHVPGGSWSRLVGWRCSTAPWAVYFSLPESVLSEGIAQMVRRKLLFAGIIALLALLAGALFAAVILRPVRQLADGALALGAGDFNARVAIDRQDELGGLGATFNSMAARIQEQAEALRRESQDQYRQLFQTMMEGYCTIEMIFDAQNRPVDFVYLETNQEFDEHSGLHNVVGRRKSEVVPQLADHWMQVYGSVALTGKPVRIEAEEQGRHYDVRAYRVGGPDSRRVAVLFNNITERLLAQRRQQAQLESLNLLHQITRAIDERQDLGSIFQVVLRALEERLPADFACVCVYEAEQHLLRVACVGERSRALADQMDLREQAHIAIEADGMSRCVSGHLVYEPEIAGVPFPFPRRLASAGLSAFVAAPLLVEGKAFGVLITARRAGGFSSGECEFLRQLSEHVALAAHHARLYATLQSAFDDLHRTQQAVLQQERLRALGQMASGIAHDINNAISPIALYTDSLLEREAGLSEPGRGQLRTIQRAIHDVAATVARMREFYRAREPQLLLAPTQLNDLVQQVAELTRARWSTMAQQRGVTIELRTDLAPGLPVIMAAQNEIREALTNLVFNAVDAMPSGGVLTLATCVVGPDRVQVEVRDTGIGMDEDSRRRCLEPFFTTKGERGTGLGLAMVYGTVQRHGAEIDIQSEPGKGTNVRLLFKAVDAVPDAEESGAAIVAGGLRILLVDDDPVLLDSMRDILEHDGHHVVAAGGGREGIEAARAAMAQGRRFAVAITDLGMPHIDGRQVASALKAMAPDLPVIMLTGWGQRLVSEGDIPPDVDLVLSKPPRLRDLREALARFAGVAARD